MEDEATKVEQVTTEMDDLSFDPTMKKKKSSIRKSVAFKDPSTAEVAPATTEQSTSPAAHCVSIANCITDAAEEPLCPAKKKSAKKILKDTTIADNNAAEEKPTDDGELDFSSLKKKKKRRVIEDQVAALDAQLEDARVVDRVSRLE